MLLHQPGFKDVWDILTRMSLPGIRSVKQTMRMSLNSVTMVLSSFITYSFISSLLPAPTAWFWGDMRYKKQVLNCTISRNFGYHSRNLSLKEQIYHPDKGILFLISRGSRNKNITEMWHEAWDCHFYRKMWQTDVLMEIAILGKSCNTVSKI